MSATAHAMPPTAALASAPREIESVNVAEDVPDSTPKLASNVVFVVVVAAALASCFVVSAVVAAVFFSSSSGVARVVEATDFVGRPATCGGGGVLIFFVFCFYFCFWA
jgi:hypothetical protein